VVSQDEVSTIVFIARFVVSFVFLFVLIMIFLLCLGKEFSVPQETPPLSPAKIKGIRY
jgi:hypothetical protein